MWKEVKILVIQDCQYISIRMPDKLIGMLTIFMGQTDRMLKVMDRIKKVLDMNQNVTDRTARLMDSHKKIACENNYDFTNYSLYSL